MAGREQVLLDADRNPKGSGSGAYSRMFGVLPVRRLALVQAINQLPVILSAQYQPRVYSRVERSK
jgi:hypothetical protein